MLPELREFVQRHELQTQVVFAGFRNDVAQLLEALDVFVLPSITEGIPIALLEACACARPIVASRVGGVPEVIRHGESGLLVDVGDVAGLAGAIDGLLNNRALAQRLGCQAAADVTARYSTSQMVRDTWQAYELALRDRRAGLP
jgi:glycosyltransferase involved in cell wall biosynthesis